MVSSKISLHAGNSSFSFSSCAFSTNICSLFIFNLLMNNNACCSLTLSSFDTLYWSAWRVLIGSATRLTLTSLIYARWLFASSICVCNDPSSNGMNMRSRVLSVSSKVALTCYRLAWILLTCPTLAWSCLIWICNSHRYFCMFPSSCWYWCLNYIHSSVTVLWTLSLISSKAPLVRTIGSMCTCLSNFCFLLSLEVFSLWCFVTLKGVLYSFPPLPSSSDPSLFAVCW